MGQKRVKCSPAESEYLFSQVGGICPVCSLSLTYEKIGRLQKQYEIAHIYPLNPTDEEVELLKNEERLSDDVNSIDNLIPLCPGCHNRFDKPRTIEEYRALLTVKKSFIQAQDIKSLYGSYKVEDEIRIIITALASLDLELEASPLDYSAIRVDEKLSKEFDQILRRHIKDDVIQYYNYVKMQFSHIENTTPGKFNLVAGQIRTFYLSAKMKSMDQVVIFNEVSKWLQARVGYGSLEACKVIVAFFIQNCEVFEIAAK